MGEYHATKINGHGSKEDQRPQRFRSLQLVDCLFWYNDGDRGRKNDSSSVNGKKQSWHDDWKWRDDDDDWRWDDDDRWRWDNNNDHDNRWRSDDDNDKGVAESGSGNNNEDINNVFANTMDNNDDDKVDVDDQSDPVLEDLVRTVTRTVTADIVGVLARFVGGMGCGPMALATSFLFLPRPQFVSDRL